jgi:NADH-quinone oxidoreductase subunit J
VLLAATDVLVAQNIAFGIIAAIMVFSAIRVVTTSNVVHAALYLVGVLAGVAAQYVLLAAEFVAVTQVLVYIGAIVVLFLFGIMLTQARLGKGVDLDNKPMRPWAAGIGVLLLALLGYVLWDAFEDTELEVVGATTYELGQTTDQVGDAIFGTYLVPFEAVSVLLLAALIGAIVLARRD